MFATLHAPEMRLNDRVQTLLELKGGKVYTIPMEATVYQAVQLMAEKEVGALVVLSAGQMAGLISERDYARKVVLRGRNSHYTTVREVMVCPVPHVSASHSVEECMHLMTTRRVRHLPVLEGEEVIGILSQGDVVNWILKTQRDTINHLRSYIAGAYPG